MALEEQVGVGFGFWMAEATGISFRGRGRQQLETRGGWGEKAVQDFLVNYENRPLKRSSAALLNRTIRDVKL